MIIFIYFLECNCSIMKFIIPVVFYEVTNVECVYWSNTTTEHAKTMYTHFKKGNNCINIVTLNVY